jgi:two-component system, response regulator YesN
MKALLSRFFVRTFVYVTLIVAITVITLSFIQYFQFEDLVLKKVYSYASDNLSKINESVVYMQSIAKILSMQAYYDLHVSKLILYKNPSFEDINIALNQLKYYNMIPEFVDSIYVYNTNTGVFYTSPYGASETVSSKDDFFDKGAVSIIDNLERYKQFSPYYRTADMENVTGIRSPSKEIITFLYYDSPGSGKEPDGVVFVNISKEWLLSMSSGFKQNIDNQLYILQDDGSVIMAQGNILKEDDLKRLNETMASRSGSGYLVQNINGTDMLITYLRSDSFQWKYVSFTPYDDVVKEVKHMKNEMVLIGLLIMSFGLVISIIVARTIYIPFQDVQGKLQHLQSEKQRHLDRGRQDFLKNMLQENEAGGDSALRENYEYYGVKLRCANPIVLVLVKIDEYHDQINRLGLKKVDMLKQSAMRVITETVGGVYTAEAVEMGKEKIVLLVQKNTGEANVEDFSEGLLPFLESIQAAIARDLNFTVSLTVSTVSDETGNLPLLYNQILEASFHRMFHGNQCIIFADDIEKLNRNEFKYPVHKEKQLLNELMQGKMEECKKIYLDIVSDFSGYSRSAVVFAFSYLVFNLNTVINTIINMNFDSNPLSYYSLSISLDEVESIGEVNNKFFKVFDEISERLKEKRLSKSNDLTKRVMEYIESNHSNPNLTEFSISEAFHVSPSHLGRLFKKLKSWNIVDFINNVRVEHAKVLLKNTNLTVEQISIQTGFSTIAYFYRVFKKFNSLTPNEYRKKMLP